VIVEAPTTDLLAQGEHLWRPVGIGHLRQHAVERRKILAQDLPLCVVTDSHHRAAAVRQQGGGPQAGPGPDALPLDLRVKAKQAVARRRIAKVDGVAEFVGGKSEPQADRLLIAGLLRFRARPQRRLHAALAGQRCDHAALRGAGEEAQRTVQIGLAAAVGTGAYRELA